MMNKHSPLEVKVVDGVLSITIGVDTLSLAATFNQEMYDYIDIGDSKSIVGPFATGDYYRSFIITDPEVFAKDVRLALLREDEMGATLLTKLVDEATKEALEDGSDGVACEDENGNDIRLTIDKYHPSEKWRIA